MGYLAHILIAAATLFAYEDGLRVEFRSLFGVLALCAAPYAWMWIGRQLTTRGRFKLGGLAHTALSWSGPTAFVVATCVFGWPALVGEWTGWTPSPDGWPDAGLVLSLAPFVLYTWLGIDAAARANEVRAAEIARARSFQARMFLSALTPFGLFLAVTWVIGANARVRANVEQVALWAAVLTVVLSVTAILALPAMIRRSWDTIALPAGPVRTLIEGFSRHVDFRCREFVVWRTGYQMANAAVVGLGPRTRVVIFSDLLLSQLPPKELLAVLAHEIGHVARRHVITFFAWSVAFFLTLDVALESFEVRSEWAAGGALIAVLGVWWFAFGWLSRRSELEADLYAMQTTGDVMAMVRALELVGGPHSRSKDSWRHFSTARRIEFLLRAAEDDAFAARLTRRMKLLARTGFALAALACAGKLWRLTESYPDDRVRVALVMGEYERAVALSRDRTDIASDTRRLVECAARLPAESRTPEALERTAQRELRAGATDSALDTLMLLSLRGEERASAVYDAIESEDAAGAAEALRASEPEWADAIEAALRAQALRTGSR